MGLPDRPDQRRDDKKWVFHSNEMNGGDWYPRTWWDTVGDWTARAIVWGGAALILIIVLAVILSSMAPHEPRQLAFP